MIGPLLNRKIGLALINCRNSITNVALFSIINNILLFTFPLYTLQIFDRVLNSGSTETLTMLTVMAIGLVSLQGLLDNFRGSILWNVSNQFDLDLSESVLRLAIEKATISTKFAASGISDLRDLRVALSHPSMTAIFDLPWVPVFIAIVFVLNTTLGYFVLASMVVLVTLGAVTVIASRQPQSEEAGKTIAAAESINDYIYNAEIIKSMGMVGAILSRWRAQNCELMNLNSRVSARVNSLLATTRYFRILIQIGLTGFGALLVLEHEMSAGGIIASSIMMGRALAPVEQAVSSWKVWLSGWLSFRRLAQSLITNELPSQIVVLPEPRGEIRTESLSYWVPNVDKPILREVTFRLGAGETLGIVGPSGAGKSTLARLLAGIWRPTRGVVRIDGADVSMVDSDWLGRYVGYLPQTIRLLSGTIAQNISRFELEPDSDAIIAAAEAAQVHNMILRTSCGYNTVIGSGGVQLSGGQQQRIALARALYREPRLLVLDEPNTHLDPEGEAALVDAVNYMQSRGCTIIMVTHRPSMLKHVDWVILLRNGCIELAGSPTEFFEKLNDGSRGQ